MKQNETKRFNEGKKKQMLKENKVNGDIKRGKITKKVANKNDKTGKGKTMKGKRNTGIKMKKRFNEKKRNLEAYVE